jgi:hypothetical protein
LEEGVLVEIRTLWEAEIRVSLVQTSKQLKGMIETCDLTGLLEELLEVGRQLIAPTTRSISSQEYS